MVVNTVIDLGGSKKPTLSPTKPRVVALNLTGEAMRQHQSLMEARAKINVLNSNLASAMASLETANQDIDRLNAELDGLRAQNAQLKKDLDLALEKIQTLGTKGSGRKNRTTSKSDSSSS